MKPFHKFEAFLNTCKTSGHLVLVDFTGDPDLKPPTERWHTSALVTTATVLVWNRRTERLSEKSIYKADDIDGTLYIKSDGHHVLLNSFV